MQLTIKLKYKVFGGSKVLDRIVMITFLVIYSIGLFVALFTYLIIREADKLKTNEEKFYEDEEQMKYLKNWKNGGKTNE